MGSLKERTYLLLASRKQPNCCQPTKTEAKKDSGEKSFWSKAILFVYYIFVWEFWTLLHTMWLAKVAELLLPSSPVVNSTLEQKGCLFLSNGDPESNRQTNSTCNILERYTKGLYANSSGAKKHLPSPSTDSEGHGRKDTQQVPL